MKSYPIENELKLIYNKNRNTGLLKKNRITGIRYTGTYVTTLNGRPDISYATNISRNKKCNIGKVLVFGGKKLKNT